METLVEETVLSFSKGSGRTLEKESQTLKDIWEADVKM